MTAFLGIVMRPLVNEMVRSGKYRVVLAGLYPTAVKGYFTPYWVVDRFDKKQAEA